MSGEIPAELGNLTNLQELHLGTNRLSGEIPKELGSLANLTRLSLRDNQLSGEIPAELGSLVNLTELFLNKNRLSGEIPEELGTLINLKYLYLGGNQLTGCVPTTLRSIYSNDLTGLGLPFCDMLGGSPVVVMRFISEPGALVRLGSGISLEATFSESVSRITVDDISVTHGTAGNFAGSGAAYTFDVTPNAVGEVTVIIAAGAAEDTGGNGNWASTMPLGIPYDDDGDGEISKSEAIASIRDYFAERVAKVHVIGIISLYLFGPPPGPGTAATPGAPTGLTAAANGQTQIDLSWKRAFGRRRRGDHGVPDRGIGRPHGLERPCWRLRLHLHDPLPYRPDGGEHAALPGVGHQLRRRRQRVGHRHRGHGFGASSRVASHRQSPLVALYNATGGADWTDNINWLSDGPSMIGTASIPTPTAESPRWTSAETS